MTDGSEEPSGGLRRFLALVPFGRLLRPGGAREREKRSDSSL
jgi:hypothetical protein